MRLKYIGESFGVDGLTDGQTYIATVGDMDFYRVFDDSGEDYLYSRINPAPLDGSCPGGRWEVVDGMTDEEKELDRKFKEGKEKFNDLANQSAAIAAKYAELYKDEIESYRI